MTFDHITPVDTQYPSCSDLEKMRKARRMWLDILRKMEAADSSLVRLMRHPNTTPEQLWAAHEASSTTYAQHVLLREGLRKRFPRVLGYRGGFIPPWFKETPHEIR